MQEDAKVYSNSMKLEQEWEDYGIGDPFIMRHNGIYYLYCSTKDFRPGIKAWSSENLVDWSYEGLVTEDPITTGAYAPEVFYWNGSFYLYTSPAGKGHYVLQSESPTGPFIVKTDNLGESIDGSVFIDDDGKWYFTNAGTQGIVAHEMPDPYTIDIGVTTNAFLGHWTEGSMIWKRNGLYYMTYTGNHVFSNGYRVNYGVSKDGPFGDYSLPANNPIIISTKDEFKGLGHSATVLGPDMDSYYITYHNLIGHSAEGPPVRELNIDRLAYNGDKLVVLGPTHGYQQPAPAMPSLYGWLSEGIDAEQWEKKELAGRESLISKLSTEPVFTSEYNVRLEETVAADSGKLEALFSYMNDSNYSAIKLLPAMHKLQYIIVKDGIEKQVGETTLPKEFDYTKLHTIRVEQRMDQVLVFFDGMKKLEVPLAAAAGGKIGYAAANVKGVYEYTAFANDADGSSDFEAYKPVPGIIEAVHYLKHEDRGFHIGEKSADKGDYRAEDGVPILKQADGSYSVALEQRGDWLKYKLNTSKNAEYGIGLTLRKPKQDIVLEWSVDGGKPVKTKINADDAAFSEETAKLRVGTIGIDAGFHELKVEIISGTAELQAFDLFLTEQPEAQQAFEQLPNMAGIGLFDQDGAVFTGSGTEDDRLFGGSDDWDDYAIEVKVKLHSDEDTGGIFIRETNESYHPNQVRDAAMGYYIGIASSQLTLNRMNYDTNLLTSAAVQLVAGREYSLKVTAAGSTIEVFLNSEPKALISYTDPNPFLHGKAGIHAERSGLSFRDMIIKPLEK